MSAEQKTSVDWLRFRSKGTPQEALEALKPMFGRVGGLVNLKPLERGILGFQQGAAICLGSDMPLGRMDYGGESQRGWVRVDIPGKGCEWVQEWDALHEVEALPKAEIRRLDVALTTWDGEITHEQVVQAHASGRFTVRRPPELRQITSSDPRAGRTCYVGNREHSDKFFRAYEKGFEILAKRQISAINGHPIEGIYRCEVEFKAHATTIPWEVIERRDHYFAGAYPFCADVLPGVESDVLMRRPERAPQMDLAAALENCRLQFGPTLYTALRAYQGDMTAVWDKVVSDHHSQVLLEAGVLLVDHE
jgi:phage replication initiation protein